MPKADRVKEEIGWLKVVFAVCAALDASLAAWIVQNYGSANPIMIVSAGIGTIVFAAAVVAVNYRVYRLLGSLEDP